MKRTIVFLVIMFLVCGAVFADEATLIDFSKLTVDSIPDASDINGNGDTAELTQNRHTLLDYSNTVGNSYTQDQRNVMKSSLALPNWKVTLTASARSIANDALSFTKHSKSKLYTDVMGVRVHFPVEPYNAHAYITPPFDIPAFETSTVGEDGTIAAENADVVNDDAANRFIDGYGVLKNVGTIKSVAANIYGLKFPHSVSAILIDGYGNKKTIFLGYVNFDGWGELRWDNPAYVTEVRNRELRLYPLYPDSTPFVKFGGFLVQRDAARSGGDFIVYFKDVKIIYDKAVLDTERDIEDESLWNIIQTRETEKKIFEMERFGHNQVLRYLEEQKKATENTFTPSPDPDAATN
jgi:hypothetical protein